MLAPIRALAGHIIDTSKFNVHELRDAIKSTFRGGSEESKILVQVTSFGYRHGVPADSDLVFDVRFLPNPNYIPAFKNLTGRNPSVARYIRSFPQTVEFVERISAAAEAEGLRALLGLAKETLAVTGTRGIGKADMRLNDAMPLIEVHPETYEVRANGELLTCEAAAELPLAQRYFLY